MKTTMHSFIALAIMIFSLNSIADWDRQPGISFNLCEGTFTGYYAAHSQPLSMTLTPSGRDYVNVIINFDGKTWSGSGTCYQSDYRDSADVNLNFRGAPNHSGTIYIENGRAVFSGSQYQGYSFTVSRPLDNRGSDICSGTFTGYYDAHPDLLTITLVPTNNYGDVSVSVYYDGQSWNGTGTCRQYNGRSADVNLRLRGAPDHYGTIRYQGSQVVFSGTQRDPRGYRFQLYRQN